MTDNEIDDEIAGSPGKSDLEIALALGTDEGSVRKRRILIEKKRAEMEAAEKVKAKQAEDLAKEKAKKEEKAKEHGKAAQHEEPVEDFGDKPAPVKAKPVEADYVGGITGVGPAPTPAPAPTSEPKEKKPSYFYQAEDGSSIELKVVSDNGRVIIFDRK